MTGNWDKLFEEKGQDKSLSPIPIEPHKKLYEAGDNNTSLHKVYVPPAYLAQPGGTYTGYKKSE